ncbi:hypothetical protein SUDANB15_07607 (plasmid) [Streptomyces sp. enrichment culture]
MNLFQPSVRLEEVHWYRENDLLPDGLEAVIDAASSLDDTVQQILHESGLDQVLPIDR